MGSAKQPREQSDDYLADLALPAALGERHPDATCQAHLRCREAERTPPREAADVHVSMVGEIESGRFSSRGKVQRHSAAPGNSRFVEELSKDPNQPTFPAPLQGRKAP